MKVAKDTVGKQELSRSGSSNGHCVEDCSRGLASIRTCSFPACARGSTTAVIFAATRERW